MTATDTAIVHHFLTNCITERRWRSWNWCCDDGTRDEFGLKFWDVDADTYINGVALEIDADYDHGYLLMLVEHESSVVSCMAIAAYGGHDRETGEIDHDFMWYPGVCGTFFEFKRERLTAAMHWAVDAIEGMFQHHGEQERREWGKGLTEDADLS